MSLEPRESVWTWTVDRPIATTMIVLAVVVFGVLSAQQLPVSLLPELSYPTLTVRTPWAGAGPEEVEESITRPLEEILRTVEGLSAVDSVSRAGSADIRLRFRWGTRLDAASQRIRERIELVPLPEDAERPLLLRFDPALDPVLRVAFVGGASEAALRAFVDEEVQRVLERTPGVAMVRVDGGDTLLWEVALLEAPMSRYGITVREVEDRLRAANVNLAGGQLLAGDQEMLVRTVQRIDDLETLRGLILRQGDGTVVTLGDVAVVRRAVREARSLLRVGGRDAVEVSVIKEADANLVQVARALRRVFGEQGRAGELALPAGVEILTLSDPAHFIETALDEVVRTALLGGGIAILVLWLALRRWYATLVIALAIPLSVIATLAGFRVLGVSLNLMSLGGLALGIGMLVDNAIVVLEAIVRRREEGAAVRAASVDGTSEVAAAVTASTLTTVAVFLPVVFLDGIAGQLFRDLALAVVLSLLASLLFALLFVPMLAALPGRVGAAPVSTASPLRWGRSVSALVEDIRGLRALPAWRRVLASPVLVPWWLLRTALWLPCELLLNPVLGLARGMAKVARAVARRGDASPRGGIEEGALYRVYKPVLRAALRGGAVVLVLAVATVGAALHRGASLPVQLLPELREGVFEIEIQWPIGTPLRETSERLRALESALAQEAAVERFSVFAGDREDAFEAREQGDHVAYVTVRAAPGATSMEEREAAMLAAVERALSQTPGIRTTLRRPTLLALEAPLTVELRGGDLDALRARAAVVESALRGASGVLEVTSSMRPGYPEVRVVFDRERLAALGLDLRDVADTVRRKVQGVVPTQVREADRNVDVWVALAREEVQRVEDLRHLVIGFLPAAGPSPVAAAGVEGLSMVGGNPAPVAGGVPVTLSQVASLYVGQGPAEIRRLEGQRAALLALRTSLWDLRRAGAEVEDTLRALDPAPGQSWRVGGQFSEIGEARRGLGQAMLLAIFLVVVLLASSFESMRVPILVMSVLPLALVGVVAALALTGQPLSVLAAIALIVLIGIVVNNAIVLVDAVERARRDHATLFDAVVAGASRRLRPVLITSATTVLGLVPLGWSAGEGAEIRRPLAIVLAGGLTSGTLLTLIVFPTLLLWALPRVVGSGAAQPVDDHPLPRVSGQVGSGEERIVALASDDSGASGGSP